MAVDAWDRNSIGEFVDGRVVFLRNAAAGEVECPDWLAQVGGLDAGLESPLVIDSLHPEDRLIMVESFVSTVGAPGEVVSFEVRSEVEPGEWFRMSGRWLNLIDHSDVGALLCVVDTMAPVEVDPPERGDAGDHDDVAWMMVDFDGSGEIQRVTGRVGDLLGRRPEELVGRTVSAFIDPSSTADSIVLWMDLVRAPGATATSRRRWIRADGTRIWLETSYLNQGATADAPSILAICWDITARMVEERELADKRDELEALAADFQLLADEVPSAVVRCDGAGVVEFHNARWDDLVGGDGLGARVQDLVAPESREVLGAALADVANGARDQAVLEVRAADSSRAWRVRLRSVAPHGEGSRAVVCSLDDVTDTVTLRRRAERDALTGLLNRSALAGRLAGATESEGRAAVMFIDMDGFKQVNDMHGHAVGDLVLMDTAQRLEHAVRPSDTVVRFGGDEFVVVCPGAAADDPALLKRIHDVLAEPVRLPEGTWIPSASIGVTTALAGDDADAVVHRADVAMFEAKRERQEPAAASDASRIASSE